VWRILTTWCSGVASTVGAVPTVCLTHKTSHQLINLKNNQLSPVSWTDLLNTSLDKNLRTKYMLNEKRGDNPHEIKTRCRQKKPNNEFQLESHRIYIMKHRPRTLIIKMKRIPLHKEQIPSTKKLLQEWPTLLLKGWGNNPRLNNKCQNTPSQTRQKSLPGHLTESNAALAEESSMKKQLRSTKISVLKLQTRKERSLTVKLIELQQMVQVKVWKKTHLEASEAGVEASQVQRKNNRHQRKPQLVPNPQTHLANPFRSGSCRVCSSVMRRLTNHKVAVGAEQETSTQLKKQASILTTEYNVNGAAGNLEKFRLTDTYLFVNKNTKQI